MKLFEYIVSLFVKKQKPSAEVEILQTKKNERSPDFIDYDGMGNQGRFPKKKEKLH